MLVKVRGSFLQLGGRKLTMLFAIHHRLDRSTVSTHNRLIARLEVYPTIQISTIPSKAKDSLLLHLPIHPSCEGFIVVRSEANIEYGCSMLILLDQLSALLFGSVCIIQVNMSIP
jgi:hypothetical protein